MGEIYSAVSIIPAKLRCILIVLPMLKYILAEIYVKYCTAATVFGFTVLNLQVLEVYAYKPVKNFAFKKFN